MAPHFICFQRWRAHSTVLYTFHYATLYLYSTTFQKEILYFLHHYIYLTAIATSYFARYFSVVEKYSASTCITLSDSRLIVCLFVFFKVSKSEPEISSFLFHAFFFLIRTWRLHYPQCSSTADNLVRDPGVLC